jgi:hypothetical protein
MKGTIMDSYHKNTNWYLQDALRRRYINPAKYTMVEKQYGENWFFFGE